MFSESLKYLRKRNGLTQDELAAATHISRSTIASYERGLRQPSFENLEVLADYFNVNMSVLVGEEKKPAPIGNELDSQLIKLLTELTPAEILKVTAFCEGLKANRKD